MKTRLIAGLLTTAFALVSVNAFAQNSMAATPATPAAAAMPAKDAPMAAHTTKVTKHRHHAKKKAAAAPMAATPKT